MIRYGSKSNRPRVVGTPRKDRMREVTEILITARRRAIEKSEVRGAQADQGRGFQLGVGER